MSHIVQWFVTDSVEYSVANFLLTAGAVLSTLLALLMHFFHRDDADPTLRD